MRLIVSRRAVSVSWAYDESFGGAQSRILENMKVLEGCH